MATVAMARFEIPVDPWNEEKNTSMNYVIENDGCGDKAKNIIPPFNLTGSPEELDIGFFEHIKKTCTEGGRVTVKYAELSRGISNQSFSN